MSELLTPAEAMRYLGVKRFTFDSKYRPHLTEIRRGGPRSVRFRLSELQEMRDDSPLDNERGAEVFRKRTVKDALDLTWRVQWAKSKEPYRKESLRKQVEKEMGTVPLRDLDYAAIQDWIVMLEEDGKSLATIKSRVYCLTAALKQAKPRGWIVEMPDIPKLGKPKNRRKRYLKEEPDEETLLLAAAERLVTRKKIPEEYGFAIRNVMLASLYTGARLSEVTKARPQDIHNDSISFIDRKADDDVTVPLNRTARDAFDALFEDTYWMSRVRGARDSKATEKSVQDWLSKLFTKVRKEAGLSDDVLFHTMRHTFASRLVMRGVDLYVVKDLLGHASIKQTEIYAHLAPSKAKGVIGVLDRDKTADVVPFRRK